MSPRWKAVLTWAAVCAVIGLLTLRVPAGSSDANFWALKAVGFVMFGLFGGAAGFVVTLFRKK